MMGPDAGKSWDLAIRAKRERAVRAGLLPPRDDDERRQAMEGPRADRWLDCVREAPGEPR